MGNEAAHRPGDDKLVDQMTRPNLCAIAQAALHEVVIARLIIAMCEDNLPGRGPLRKGGDIFRMQDAPVGPLPGFSVRPEVAERIRKYIERRGA